MKKLIIAAALSLVATGAYAQKANIKAAEKLASSNVAEARRLASEARQHEETKTDPQAWLVSGMIENGVFMQEFTKLQIGQPADEPTMYAALMAEMPYLLEVYNLENVPDAKGRVKLKYAKRAKDVLKSDFRWLYNAGHHYLQAQDYAKASEGFARLIEVRNHPLLSDEKDLRTPELDTLAWESSYLAVLLAYEDKKHDRAIEYAQRFRNQEYKQNEIMQVLAAAYLAKGDTLSAIPVLEQGLKLFPQEEYFMGGIVSVNVAQGKTDKAIELLEQITASGTTNPKYLIALGNLHEMGENYAKAEVALKRAIELDKAGFDTNFNLGRLYFNQGVVTLNVENLDKLTKEKAVALFQKAIPYLETAYKTEPDQVYYTLANAYYQVGDEAKHDQIKKAHE